MVVMTVCSSNKFNALIAQLVEQLICNHQARRSSRRGGTRIQRDGIAYRDRENILLALSSSIKYPQGMGLEP